MIDKKIMKRLILAISLLCLFALAPAINGQTKKRDLKNYTKGPTFEIEAGNWNSSGPEFERFRQFLWDKWSNKQQAYFKTVGWTREGAEIISHYYVEKTSVGSWRIAIRSEGDCPYSSKKDCRELRSTEYIYDKAEKIQTEDKYKIILNNSSNKDRLEY
jgi:hypothetical protein